MIIGKEKQILFEEKRIYDCVVKDDGINPVFYKVYGDEYALSCTEKEFNTYFVPLDKKIKV